MSPTSFLSGSKAVACRRVQRRGAAPRARIQGVSVRADACLIVNTNKGGHAFLGLHLAEKLLDMGHEVTIMTAGNQAAVAGKPPFNQFDALARRGATICWGDPKDPDTYPQGSPWFDVVIDNNGKDLDTCQPLMETVKRKAKQYIFVASAGAYAANADEPMHVEGDERKAKAGHVKVETYMKQYGVPYTIFQPLYMYGPHTAKDCEQWFIDRVIRNRPVPIPAPGVQLTSISHVEDVASMMAAAVGNPAAFRQEYNACGDRCITFDGIVAMVADALRMDAQIVHYDPATVDVKKAFPFRPMHFFASSDKAKQELGWQPKHSFQDDVAELCASYKQAGRDRAHIDFSMDDAILRAAR